MAWLLFLDESGHDRKQMPYEVRGGVALHVSRLWPFIQAARRLELSCFGGELMQFGKELKGHNLLDRKRFRFAAQGQPMADDERRRHSRSFLTKGLEKKPPTREEFTAYGQACVAMAEGLFQLLYEHDAELIAAVIPREVAKPETYEAEEFMRKDHVFLFERFFYLLEREQAHGVVVMDEIDRTLDSRFVRRMERYFTKTVSGRYRTTWIVPAPLFVSSHLTYAVQAADVCIYCINWGFRLASLGMIAANREEIANRFGPWLNRLQFHGQGYKDGHVFDSYGVVYVPDPYSAR